MRLIGMAAVVLLLISSLVACGRRSMSQEVEIDGTAELIASLEGAGVTVAETAILGQPVFGGHARVYQVNEAIVHVYEYETQEARVAVSEELASDGSAIVSTPLTWSDRANIWVSGRLIVVYPGTDGGTILLLSGLLGDSITHLAGPVDEPYPPAVTAAIEYLAERLEVDPGDVEVIDFAPVTWADTCLGFPLPGENCAEVLTSGWRMRMRVADRVHEVHSDQIGEWLRMR